MKNHKFIKGLALFGLALTMLIGLTGCPPATPGTGSGTGTNTGSKAGITISFDSAKLTCEKKNPVSENWEALTSGSKVKVKDELEFKIKTMPTGHIAEWKINGKLIDGAFYQTISYTVKKEDASNGKIEVKYNTKLPEKAKIYFNETKIKCLKQGDSPWIWNAIANETEIKESDKLQFFAIGLEKGKTVKEWLIGSTKEEECITTNYTILGKDIKENKLKVSYTERTAEKFTLEFDETKISAKKFNPKNDNYVDPISSGAEIYENEMLTFSALNIPLGKGIDYWTVNEKGNSEKNIGEAWSNNIAAYYSIKKADALSGKISIAYKTKTVQTYKIIFDSTITCTDAHSNKKITSGTQVNEGTDLNFEAKVPAGKFIKKWNFGSKVIETSSDNIYYKEASKEVANASNEIHVSYISRDAEKITIKFDDKKLVCAYENDDSKKVNSGDKVAEGSKLHFNTINIPADKVIDKWTGKAIPTFYNGKNYAYYTVSKEDANASNEITIDYTTKEPVKFKIIFNSTKLRCLKDGSEIQSNTEVFENDSLDFTPKNIPSNKVASWKLNANDFPTNKHNFNNLYFDVKTSHANSNNEIHIAYEERDLQKIKISFDSKLIKCVKDTDNSTVSPDSKILEGTLLRFTSILGYAVQWQVGRTTYLSPAEEKVLKVYLGKADNGSINISYSDEDILKPINTKYVGNYTGTFSGAYKGTWSGKVDKYGRFSGTFVQTKPANTMNAKGDSDSKGNFTGKITSTSVEINFTATIADDGSVSGTWKNNTENASGTLEGSKQ